MTSSELWSREPTAFDLRFLAANMRADDAHEIFMMCGSVHDADGFAARMFRMLPFAMYARVIGLDRDSRAIAFMGAWPLNDTRTMGSAALFATSDFPLLAGKFVRHFRRFVVPAMLANGVRRVECRTLSSYTASHRLLRALGAVEETGPAGLPDFGPHGETFRQFAWRKSDFAGGHENVLRVHPENGGNP